LKIVASITSKFGNNRGYKAMSIASVQNYTIDSAMDTDSDSWSIDIGDPSFELIDLLKRDTEVRVQLIGGASPRGTLVLKTGFADLVALTQDGTLALSGRDVSAAAIDSTHPPMDWKNIFPDRLVKKEAMTLGFTSFQLQKVDPFEKFYTDASESYWEMWYRMYRKRKMWMWVSSEGGLYADLLNYGAPVSYYIGEPDKQRPNVSQWIRPQTVEIRKNTQTRIHTITVFGHTGKKQGGFSIPVTDHKIDDWIKKPTKIITESGITKKKDAIAEAVEQVFEGEVGSVEITITIKDPGFNLEQNRIARLNIPDMNFVGDYFVVGVRLMNGPDGPLQEVRLREKKFAISRRTPKDPVIVKDPQVDQQTAGQALTTGSKNDWGQYFVIAAKAWHGTWDLSLFLATLLAVCQIETTFTNVRAPFGGPEWYPKPNLPPDEAIWRAQFANSKNNAFNPYAPSDEAAVGAMQLKSLSLKQEADARFGTTADPEYEGGRWDPASNIYVAAHYIASLLQGIPRTEDQLYSHIGGYYTGAAGIGSPAANAYGKKVENLVRGTYLAEAEAALGGPTLPANSSKTHADLAANVPDTVRKIINFAERQLGKPYSHINRFGPEQYDCSGLATAAYRASGFPNTDHLIGGPPFTTYSMFSGGSGSGNLVPVNKNNLSVGDLVFFDNGLGGAQPGHMGIYYQDGTVIAANTHGVTVSDIGTWAWMGAMHLPDLWVNG
jgi:cell wall-associated NlpC family hydrolase/prophage tail gpP-like protein